MEDDNQIIHEELEKGLWNFHHSMIFTDVHDYLNSWKSFLGFKVKKFVILKNGRENLIKKTEKKSDSNPRLFNKFPFKILDNQNLVYCYEIFYHSLFQNQVQVKVIYKGLFGNIYILNFQNKEFQEYLKIGIGNKPSSIKLPKEVSNLIKGNCDQTPIKILKKVLETENYIDLSSVQQHVKRLRSKGYSWQDESDFINILTNKGDLFDFKNEEEFVYSFVNITQIKLIINQIKTLHFTFKNVPIGMDGLFKSNSESFPIYFITSIDKNFHGMILFAALMKTNSAENIKYFIEKCFKFLNENFPNEKEIFKSFIWMIDKEKSEISALKQLDQFFLLCIFHFYKTINLEIKEKCQDSNQLAVVDFIYKLRNTTTRDDYNDVEEEFFSLLNELKETNFKEYFENNWSKISKHWNNEFRSIAISLWNTNNITENIIKYFQNFIGNKRLSPKEILLQISKYMRTRQTTKTITKSFKEANECYKSAASLQNIDEYVRIDEMNEGKFIVKSFTREEIEYSVNFDQCTCLGFFSSGKFCKHQFGVLLYNVYILNKQIVYNENPVIYLMNAKRAQNSIQIVNQSININTHLKKIKTKRARKFKTVFGKYRSETYSENDQFEYETIDGIGIIENKLIVHILWTYFTPTWDFYSFEFEDLFLKLQEKITQKIKQIGNVKSIKSRKIIGILIKESDLDILYTENENLSLKDLNEKKDFKKYTFKNPSSSQYKELISDFLSQCHDLYNGYSSESDNE